MLITERKYNVAPGNLPRGYIKDRVETCYRIVSSNASYQGDTPYIINVLNYSFKLSLSNAGYKALSKKGYKLRNANAIGLRAFRNLTGAMESTTAGSPKVNIKL